MKNMYISRYEDIVHNIQDEIYKISKFLNISISDETIKDFADKLAIEKQKDRISISQTNKLLIETKYGNYDPHTLLHENHFSRDNGKIGKWKHYLNAEQKHSIKTNYQNWLTNNGYL